MTEFKTEKEKILELKAKIQELRMKKLLTIENLEKEANRLTGEVEKISKDLRDKKIDFKVASVLLKAIDSEKGILRECRIGLTLLIKEQGKLEFELLKLGG